MIIRGATLISRLAVIFTVLSTLAACGSGGGGSSFYHGDEDAPPAQSVSLEALTSTTQGLLYSSLVTASDSDGSTYTGSIVIANQAQINLDGVLVTPRDTVTSLRNDVDSVTVTVTETSYIDDSGYLVSTTTPAATCTASSPAKLPASVNIGDSGVLSTLTCDNDTIQNSTWKVESAASDGNISLVISTTTTDQSNIIISTENTTFTLDSDGNIVSVKSEATQSASGDKRTVETI